MLKCIIYFHVYFCPNTSKSNGHCNTGYTVLNKYMNQIITKKLLFTYKHLVALDLLKAIFANLTCTLRTKDILIYPCVTQHIKVFKFTH